MYEHLLSIGLLSLFLIPYEKHECHRNSYLNHNCIRSCNITVRILNDEQHSYQLKKKNCAHTNVDGKEPKPLNMYK